MPTYIILICKITYVCTYLVICSNIRKSRHYFLMMVIKYHKKAKYHLLCPTYLVNCHLLSLIAGYVCQNRAHSSPWAWPKAYKSYAESHSNDISEHPSLSLGIKSCQNAHYLKWHLRDVYVQSVSKKIYVNIVIQDRRILKDFIL